MKDVEAAWLAGLFEGEGCISLAGTRVQLSIAMTDRDVVERFVSMVGYGKVTCRPGKLNGEYKKEMFYWQIGDHKIVGSLLRIMIPYFGGRRKAKAFEALEILREFSGVGHSRSKKIYAFGEWKWLSDWVADSRCVVSADNLRYRINRGWTPEKSIMTPLQTPRKGPQNELV